MLYQGIRFNIKQLQDMMHRLVEETHRDLIDLLMLEMNAEGEVEEGQLPAVDWDRLNDNAGEEKVE